jgi:hypothetical protein
MKINKLIIACIISFLGVNSYASEKCYSNLNEVLKCFVQIEDGAYRYALQSEEVRDNIAAENASYEINKVIINNKLKGLKKRLEDIILDPYKKLKEDIAKFKKNINDKKKFKDQLKSVTDNQKLRQLALNITKTIVVTTTSLLSQELIKIISNNASLQELVDKEYYEKAATIKRWIDDLTILFEKRKEKVNNI